MKIERKLEILPDVLMNVLDNHWRFNKTRRETVSSLGAQDVHLVLAPIYVQDFFVATGLSAASHFGRSEAAEAAWWLGLLRGGYGVRAVIALRILVEAVA